MASYDNSNNFFRFHCDVVGQQRYIAGCRRSLKRIADGSDGGLWPECAAACRDGRCPTIKMNNEELAAWDKPAIYYRDRDDCGAGVAQRAELGLPARTATEIADHHALLGALKLQAVSVEIGDAMRGVMRPGAARRPVKFKAAGVDPSPAPAHQAAAPKPAAAPMALSIGDLINEELAK